MTSNTKSYFDITEGVGYKASYEQIRKLLHRYYFAAQFCEAKDILEIGCGSGVGLGYLAKKAKKAVGIDIDEKNLELGLNYYHNRENIDLIHMDARSLAFSNGSFDVVICCEVIYYLNDSEAFIKEAQRVLREKGILIISTLNKDHIDFNPSPLSVLFLSVPGIYRLLSKFFSRVDMYGTFSLRPGSAKESIIAIVKRTAVLLHIMPKAKILSEFIKRIFYGKLVPLPPELIESMLPYCPPESLNNTEINKDYKVIYAIAKK